jgi:hypothetical protein
MSRTIDFALVAAFVIGCVFVIALTGCASQDRYYRDLARGVGQQIERAK